MGSWDHKGSKDLKVTATGHLTEQTLDSQQVLLVLEPTPQQLRCLSKLKEQLGKLGSQ